MLLGIVIRKTVALALMVVVFVLPASATADLSEGFEDISTLEGRGWIMMNNSDPQGVTGWFQGELWAFDAYEGTANSYIAADYRNVASSGGTISNWLITPVLTLDNGCQLSFYTGRVASQYADRLQVRISTAGSSIDVGTLATDVGDFTTMLLDINPDYTYEGYPAVVHPPKITEGFSMKLSGLAGPIEGRIAFRYFVEDVPKNGDYIGIDSFNFCMAAHPGDANNDGFVDIGDLGILSGNWGGGPGKIWEQGDFTGDGYVDVGDLGVLSGNWGWIASGGMQPIPEPATMSLLALGGLACISSTKAAIRRR